MSERPEHSRPRRLVDWINPTGARPLLGNFDVVSGRPELAGSTRSRFASISCR